MSFCSLKGAYFPNQILDYSSVCGGQYKVKLDPDLYEYAKYQLIQLSVQNVFPLQDKKINFIFSDNPTAIMPNCKNYFKVIR